MKLELKHLAGYLPYGLKVYRENKSIESDTFLIVGASKINVFLQNNGLAVVDMERIKPILRPLSDLTKEIEVNGEKFVPIEYNAFKHSKEDIIEFQNKFIHYKGMKFGIIERLLEWHFDIYGLIENNLAIDKNTIK